MIKNKEKEETYRLAELYIAVGDGRIVVTEDDTLEFESCTPMSINFLEAIIKEAKEFIEYRDDKNIQLSKT